MGQEYFFENYCVLRNSSFSRTRPFVLLFAFLFVDQGFSLLPLKYFINFKRSRSFRSRIVAKVYTIEKAHFPSFKNCFSICRVSTFKLCAEGKSFTDYTLIIVAEIYIIFRSELNRQMNNGPQSLGTDGSNDQSGIKKLNPVLIPLFVITKGKSLFISQIWLHAKRVSLRHFLIISIPFYEKTGQIRKTVLLLGSTTQR